MKKVTITEQGDSEYLEGDIVELTKVRASNKNLLKLVELILLKTAYL